MITESFFDKGEKFTQIIMLPLIITLLLTVWLFPWSIFKKLRRSSGEAKKLRGPRGLPLVGYLPFLGRNIHQKFMELAKVYGPIYRLPLGQRQCVIISSAQLAKEVLRDHDITFANRNPIVAVLALSFGGIDIAFTPYGPEWRMLRKIFAQEMMSKANLDAFYSLRRDEIKTSFRDMYGKCGAPIDVGVMTFSTVINMVTSLFWGGNIQGDRDTHAEFPAAVKELIVIWGKPNISDFIPSLARYDLQGIEKDIKRASIWIEQIFDSVIDQRMENKAGKGITSDQKHKNSKDFLDFLLDFKDQDTGNSLSRAQIKAFLADILIGGTGTTANAIEWTMAELMLHPESMKKAQEELTEVVGADKTVDELHIYKLPYLHAVVKETLRLHPPTPLLLPRCPTQSCNVGGYTICKGDKVFINAWAIHRDSQFWNNPLKFQPERFLGDNSNNLNYLGNNFHYIPFGSGRRVCPGLRLGERLLIYVLATFLHMFDWKMPKGKKPDTEEKFGIVLEKSTPLIAITTPRLCNLELYK